MARSEFIENSTAMAKAVGAAHAAVVNLRASGLNARQMIALGTLEGHLNAISDANAAIGDTVRQEQDAATAEKRAKALPV